MEQTLGAAHELFAERGYAAVTMDEIAAAVGVTKPLLYNYFGNKERLYIACMERAGDALTATVAEAVAASASPGDALGAGVHAFFAFLDSDRAAWAVLFDETLPNQRRDRRPGRRIPRPDPRARLRLDARAAAAAQPGGGANRNRGALRRPARRRRGARALVAAHAAAQRRRGRRASDLHRRARPAGPLDRLPDFPARPKRNALEMNSQTRRVAVLGGNRIPFARSDSAYAHASNQDMLTAALDGLVDRFGLRGRASRRGRRRRRPQALPRPRPRPARACSSTRLAPETPAYDVQQACGTGLETTILVANKIALGQIDAGIACGADTTSDAPIALNEQLRATLLEANRQRSTGGKLKALTRAAPGPRRARRSRATRSRAPASRWASTARSWRPNGTSAATQQDELTVASHQNLAAAYERGFLDDLITPYLGLERDQNLRPDSSLEKLAKLKPVFGGAEGTMTAANSTPLSDGASAVLLASEEWAKAHGPAGPRLHQPRPRPPPSTTSTSAKGC